MLVSGAGTSPTRLYCQYSFPNTEREVLEGMYPSKLTVRSDAEAILLLANALQVHTDLQELPV